MARKERVAVLSLLWSLLWIFDKQQSNNAMLLVQATAVPSPAPWFRGPPISRPTPGEDDARKRQKKVRKIKKKKRNTAISATKTVDMCTGASHVESLADQAKEAPATDKEAPSIDALDTSKKKRRKVKVKRRRRSGKDIRESTTEGSAAESSGEMADEGKHNGSETTRTTITDNVIGSERGGLKRRRRKVKVKRNQTQLATKAFNHEADAASQNAGTVLLEDTVAKTHADIAPNLSISASTDNTEVETESSNKENANDAALSSKAAQGTSEKTEGVAVEEEKDDVQDLSLTEASVKLDSVGIEMGNIESELVAAEVSMEDGKVDETMEGEEQSGEKDTHEVSASIHETFEREIARVDGDYVPNLAEFDTSASEEEKDEGLASVTTETTNAISNREEEAKAGGVDPEVEVNKQPGPDEQATEDGSDNVTNVARAIDEISESVAKTEEQEERDRGEQSQTDAVVNTSQSLLNTTTTDSAPDDGGSSVDVHSQADTSGASYECSSEAPEKSDEDETTHNQAGADEERADEKITNDGSNDPGDKIPVASSVADEGNEHNVLRATELEAESKKLTNSILQQTSLGSSLLREILKLDNLNDDDDDSDLTVSVVTWNLAEESPSEDDASFIRRFRESPTIGTPGSKSFRKGSDIVLVSGQECENTKPRRAEGHRSRISKIGD